MRVRIKNKDQIILVGKNTGTDIILIQRLHPYLTNLNQQIK